MTGPTAPAETPQWWAKKLYDDLAFAAPELWLLHIQRRFEEALDAAAGDRDALRSRVAALETALRDAWWGMADCPPELSTRIHALLRPDAPEDDDARR